MVQIVTIVHVHYMIIYYYVLFTHFYSIYSVLKNDEQSDPKEFFIKKILKSDVYLEQLLKDCINMFPFKNCTIFRKVNLLL